VQHYRDTKKDRSDHRQEFGLKAAAAVEVTPPGDEAAQQQHPAGESPQQSQAYAKLLAMSVFSGNIVMKM
jgi:hypothetical protein